MNRTVPLWVLLFCLLSGVLFLVVFGWSVKSTLSGSQRSGQFGKAAVVVASFPNLVKDVFEQITSDTGETRRVPRPDMKLEKFVQAGQAPGIDVEGVLVQADTKGVAAASGWRVLAGAFVVDGSLENAALAFSPAMQIEHVWILPEGDIAGREPRPPHRKFVHGFDVFSDGSVVYAFDGGVSLQRIDRCGNRLWAVPGRFHHAVTIDEDEAFVWALSKSGEDAHDVVKVEANSGEIVRRFSSDEVSAANPEVDILEIRKRDNSDRRGNSRNTTEPWLRDPLHFNDVDPLPGSLADRFEGFEADDLLISARSLNLLFVVDPESMKIKWWRVGASRRQHDPDWDPSGVFTVYDNRMSRDFSRIVAIEPATLKMTTLLDGRKNDFYSRIRGKHQFTDVDTLIVASAQQGRVFEMTRAGETILEILNTDTSREDSSYVISEALWKSPSELAVLSEVSCEK